MNLKVITFPMVASWNENPLSYEYSNESRGVQHKIFCAFCKHLVEGDRCIIEKGSTPFRGNCFESRNLNYSPVSMKKL